MKKLLSILAVSAVVLTISSCSKGSPNPTPTQGSMEIKVGGKSIDAIVGGRSPHDNPSSGTATFTADVYASSTSADYTTLVAGNDNTNKTMSFTIDANGDASTAVGYTTAVTYPHSTAPVYLVGLYPVDAWAAPTTSAVSNTFNGTQDLMATRQVETKRSEAVAGTYKKLTFHHLLTRLDLLVKAKDAAAITAWGKVTSIIVESPNNAVTMAIANETSPVTAPATTFSGGRTDFNFFTMGGDDKYTDPSASPSAVTVELTTTATAAQSYSMVAPITATPAPYIYTIRVRTENHDSGNSDYTVPVTLTTDGTNAFTGDLRGKKFVITLTFSAAEINATATVNAWENSGEGSGTIQ